MVTIEDFSSILKGLRSCIDYLLAKPAGSTTVILEPRVRITVKKTNVTFYSCNGFKEMEIIVPLKNNTDEFTCTVDASVFKTLRLADTFQMEFDDPKLIVTTQKKGGRKSEITIETLDPDKTKIVYVTTNRKTIRNLSGIKQSLQRMSFAPYMAKEQDRPVIFVEDGNVWCKDSFRILNLKPSPIPVDLVTDYREFTTIISIVSDIVSEIKIGSSDKHLEVMGVNEDLSIRIVSLFSVKAKGIKVGQKILQSALKENGRFLLKLPEEVVESVKHLSKLSLAKTSGFLDIIYNKKLYLKASGKGIYQEDEFELAGKGSGSVRVHSNMLLDLKAADNTYMKLCEKCLLFINKWEDEDAVIMAVPVIESSK